MLLFVIDEGNKTNISAIKQALGYYVACADIRELSNVKKLDVKPLTRPDAIAAAIIQARNTLAALPDKVESYDKVFAVGIQRGVTVNQDPQPPVLMCAIALIEMGADYPVVAETRSIPISTEVRRLVCEENVPLYQAYGMVYGSDVETKKIRLYTKLTGKEEVDWLADSLSDLLYPIFK